MYSLKLLATKSTAVLDAPIQSKITLNIQAYQDSSNITVRCRVSVNSLLSVTSKFLPGVLSTLRLTPLGVVAVVVTISVLVSSV